MVFGMSVCTCVCVCTCMYRQCTLLSCVVLWHEVSSAKINLPVEVFGSDFPIKIMKRDQVSPHGARDRPGSTTVKVGFKDMWPSCTLLGLASLTAWMTFLHCFYWEIVSFSFSFFFFVSSRLPVCSFCKTYNVSSWVEEDWVNTVCVIL